MSTIETNPQPPVAAPDATVVPASGQAKGAAQPTLEGFDRWIKDFQKYESILADIAKCTADPKFKDELSTIELWFKEISESEKTAALYSLLANASEDQARFLIGVLQQKLKTEEPKSTPVLPSPAKRLGKLIRPPSLNIPDPVSPTTPTPATARESAVDERSHHSLLQQAALNRDSQRKAAGPDASLTNLVNTPLIPLFQKDKDAADKGEPAAPASTTLPGFSGINPYTLNMLANAGLSNEAQLLAAQLVMSGLVQPTALLQDKAKPKKAPGGPWRTPASARFPSSALRTSAVRNALPLKSAGLKSAAIPQTPFSAMESPREEEFDPAMLEDIPGWLRGLRLHKYTQCFDGLSWQEVIALDDAALESKGVAAVGARRRMLRAFEQARKVMGLEPIPESPASSKLSVNSPAFTPKFKAEETTATTTTTTTEGTDTPAPAAEPVTPA